MAQIVEFKRYEKKLSVAERYKALAKSQIRTFTCDTCGADIEVINGVYPDSCPGCCLKITNWNKAEANL